MFLSHSANVDESYLCCLSPGISFSCCWRRSIASSLVGLVIAVTFEIQLNNIGVTLDWLLFGSAGLPSQGQIIAHIIQRPPQLKHCRPHSAHPRIKYGQAMRSGVIRHSPELLLSGRQGSDPAAGAAGALAHVLGRRLVDALGPTALERVANREG